MRLTGVLKHDFLFQARHGFYIVYMVIVGMYVLILQWLPQMLRAHILSELLYIEVTLIGYIFIGAILLLEKDQKLVECLFVTPLRISEYLVSKTVSLLVLTLVVGFCITFFGMGAAFNPLLLCLGLVLGSVFFTLLGTAISVRAKKLNGYFLVSLPVIIVAVIPLAGALAFVEHWLFYLLPGFGITLLIRGAFSGITLFNLVYSLVSASVYIVLSWLLAHSQLKRYVCKIIGGAE